MVDCAPLGVGDHIFHARNRKPLAHSGALVNFLVFASSERDALDHLLHILRNVQLVAIAPGPRLLRSNRNAFVERSRIVRANFRTNAVFQRRNDLPTRGVVLRIGAEYKGNVKRQAHRISLNLHITFLHDVEQTHLNLAGDVRHLRVKQRCKGAKDPAFCLSTQAQQNEIVARENSVDDLRYDSVFIPHNSRKKRATLAQFADKIVAELILYTAGKETLFGEWTLAKFAERPRETHGDNPQRKQLS